MPQLGPAEILVVFVVALLVFGPKRLPEVGRQVGRGLRELRKVQETVRTELNEIIHADESSGTNTGGTNTGGTNTGGTDTPPSPYRTSGTPSLAPGAADAVGAPTRSRAPSRYRAPGA